MTEEKNFLDTHIAMSTLSPRDSDNYQGYQLNQHGEDDMDELSISKESLTQTYQSQTATRAKREEQKRGETVGGNPKHWEWEQVQKWLISKGLEKFKVVLAEGATEKSGTDGDELLGITFQTMMDDSGAYRALQKLELPSIEAAEADYDVTRFFKELTKLQLKANVSSGGDFGDKESTIDDVIEIKRRIQQFIEKWDRILWIEGYEDTNGKLPTDIIIAEELGVSQAIAEVYLHYYQNIDRMKSKDVDELLLDFNVYNDCVIWWFIIVTILGNQQTKSIWLLFNKVAELTPGNCAIALLDKYKFDLTRFDAEHLEERHIFQGMADSMIDAAFDYLNLIESDHMATIMLEVKSDIDEMSAMDMALEFNLTKFVTDQRIERVVTSIMNDFEFLRPKNRDEAFEIDPLSVKLIWRKMFYAEFYFTPLGTYTCEVLLFFLYLALFTALSIQQFRVYDEMTLAEIIFWIFNAGYVSNELQEIFTEGLKGYFGDTQNYFDALISAVFVASIVIRLLALALQPDCEGFLDENGNLIEFSSELSSTPVIDSDTPCWSDSDLNTVFVILWGVATITLWLRIINFFILSHSLGPMVQMIFRMLSDIATFFEIMLVLFLAFAMCLMFILGDVLDEFASPAIACITLFRALLGDFDFDNLADANVSTGILYFGYGIVIFYLVIGSLVLLNLLIAMMAKTFDTIEEETTAAIIFARFKLALDRDTTACFMAPPLNVLAMAFMLIFYLIEGVINSCRGLCYCCSRGCLCCKKEAKIDEFGEEEHFIATDLAVAIMPEFMKERKLELDDQVLYQNSKMYWEIETNKGPTLCKIIKYKPEIGDHYVKFYKLVKGEANKPGAEYKGIKVSVMNSVEKKHQWQVDLFDLHDEGLIDFGQFNAVHVTAEWTDRARRDIQRAEELEESHADDHGGSNKDKGDEKNPDMIRKQSTMGDDEPIVNHLEGDYKSPYWVCGFCRGYVKASKISVKRLGYALNVNPLEMKIINKIAPEGLFYIFHSSQT